MYSSYDHQKTATYSGIVTFKAVSRSIFFPQMQYRFKLGKSRKFGKSTASIIDDIQKNRHGSVSLL